MEEPHVVSSRYPTPIDPTEPCPTCLELVPVDAERCSECDEPLVPLSAPPSTLAPSTRGEPAPGFLAMHWRPLVTLGTVTGLLLTGIALRYLAPDPFSAAQVDARAAVATPACDSPCWAGEACQLGTCVWQKPAGVGHVPEEPTISGPFSLPKDTTDALLLDGERFAVARLAGTEVRNTRSGEVIAVVSEAPQSHKLYRVGDVVYATSPQRIYVVDAATTRVLKTIETGGPVGYVTLGAAGRRALVTLPSSHAIAVLTTEMHAEVDRIQFGDDVVSAIGVDDTGNRALTTTGVIPAPGLLDPKGGAAYAFDPSRFASTQDRVRASLLGNPVSVLMTPDGTASYVALRADDALVPLEWLPSGAVRQRDRIPTCREPEEVLLVRSGRRALVRCNEGRAVETFDLNQNKLLKHISLPGRPVDIDVSPDESQAVVALAGDGGGSVALIDLRTHDTRFVSLNAEPSHVRVAPDGVTTLVWSERAKTAWVLR